jgi:cytochrome c5
MSRRRFAALALALVACQAPPPPNQGAGRSGLSRSDELLLAAANVGLPPPDYAASSLPDSGSAGAKALVAYCAQCHALPAPAMHSATDWPAVVRRMWLRMEWLPPTLGVQVPALADRLAILQYLTANALRVSAATLPPGNGRESFVNVCSRCHALPDPRNHSAQDWPAVFQRMLTNMQRMGVTPPGNVEGTDILVYLQDVASRR